MPENENNLNRRRIITINYCCWSGCWCRRVGSIFTSLKPSEKARAAGAPVTVNPSLCTGMLLTIEWWKTNLGYEKNKNYVDIPEKMMIF